MEDTELKKTLESLLFITDRPLPLKELCKITGVKDNDRVGGLLSEIRNEFDEKGSGVQVLEIADGFQMATRSVHAPFVRKLFAEKMTMRLSNASLETLSIIAYKQPLTRAEVEEIRGVEVIASLETLLEKRLIEVVGRKDSVGRPLMYGSTKDFLRHFGFKSIDDLPPLSNFEPPPESETKSFSAGLSSTGMSADAESDVDLMHKSEVRVVTSSEPEAQIETETKSEPEPEAQVEIETKSEPEPEAQIETETKSEPEPEPEVRSEAPSEPKTEVEAEGVTDPVSDQPPEPPMSKEDETPSSTSEASQGDEDTTRLE